MRAGRSMLEPNRLMIALLCGGLLLAAGCGASTSPPTDEEEQALDRLRSRIDERPVVTASTAAQSEAEGQADAEADTARSEEPSLLIRPFRYAGALPDDDPRVLGVFPFRSSPDPIIDGDTVAVVGLDASMRLVGLDTEETFHGDTEEQLHAYADFAGYVAQIYAESDSAMPKFGTPLGDLAHEFAREFFAENPEVRLEIDDLRRRRGYFDRYLAYAFAQHDGVWVNYNVESVRAGMSPYFNKYGNSARFHDEFVEAQREAQEAGRGIWDPALRHYPDYEERLAWWNRRAATIEHYRQTYDADPLCLELSADDDWARLSELEGERITVFGTVADVHYDRDPARAYMSHRRGEDFTLVAFDDGVMQALGLDAHKGEYVYVRGDLGFYEGRPQFVVDRGVEVWTEP